MIYGLCRLWMKSGMCVRTSIGPSAVPAPGMVKFEFCSHPFVVEFERGPLLVAVGGSLELL